jgi:hypothetical protein
VTYAEISIALHPLESATPNTYQVELQVIDPGSEGAIAPARGIAVIDPDRLTAASRKPIEYGQLLADFTFSGGAVLKAWIAARAALAKAGHKIRLRLLLEPADKLLHGIRWELLADPETKEPLSTRGDILLSRFLFNRDWREIKLSARGKLKAVVAVAAPATGLDNFGLAQVERDVQTAPVIAALKASMEGIEVTEAAPGKPLTLEALVETLKQSPDILYLACHGQFVPKGGTNAVIYLCDAEDAAKQTPVEKLIEELVRITPPRLVVLASCQSAGFEATSEHAFAAMLSEAGVPAVVAMQGNIKMQTVEKMMPKLFAELMVDGQIDRAMAEARFAIRDNADAWMPALLLRLKQGRIWYDPGFHGGKDANEFWDEICLRIRSRNATPIVGPDLAADVLGDSNDIALQLSKSEGFPLSPRDRTDLAKVAQYLSISKGSTFTRNLVSSEIAAQAKRNFPSLNGETNITKILAGVADAQAKGDTQAPMVILAGLALKTYVNASPFPLLVHALQAAGKKPVHVVANWRPGSVPTLEQPKINKAELTPDTPLVYSLFGVHDNPDQWVLTEDDFFDFTVCAAQYKLIPSHVTKRFCRSSLLFLGFDLDSWIFRALFRLIMMQEGIGQQSDNVHIGVQLDPDDHRFSDPAKARAYLIRYFNSSRRGRGHEPEIDVYWGSSKDFLRELADQLVLSEKKIPNVEIDEEED